MGALLGAAGLQQWMGRRDTAAGAPASPSLNATGAQMVLAQDSFEGSDDARTYREGEQTWKPSLAICAAARQMRWST